MSEAVDKAYSAIREGVLNGRFRPGARLKEQELVEYCGVSRTPVREALQRLAADDYVVISRNQGAEVKDWTTTDIDDLFLLRALLEGYAAAQAALNITKTQLDGLAVAIGEMDIILSSDDGSIDKVEDFLRLNRIVHLIIWEASGSRRLVDMLGRLVEQALVARTARQFSIESLAESHHHHQEILRALIAGDQLWAESIMRSHIRAARVSLIK